MYVVGTAITARIPATDSTMVYKAMTYSKPGTYWLLTCRERSATPVGEK